jgi:hypothetical protein
MKAQIIIGLLRIQIYLQPLIRNHQPATRKALINGKILHPKESFTG